MVVRNRKKGRSLKRVCLPMAPVLLVRPERRFRHVRLRGQLTFYATGRALETAGCARRPDWRLLSGGGDCGSQECPELALFGPDRPGWRRLFLRVKRTSQLRTQTSEFDPEETSPGRGTSRGEIRDPLLSDADRFYRGGSSFSAKSSPISIRWSLNLERTLRHL
jgi:hypothetical protein